MSETLDAQVSTAKSNPSTESTAASNSNGATDGNKAVDRSAKREQAIFQRQRQLKEQEAALKAEQEKWKREQSQDYISRKALRENPRQYFEDGTLDYNQVTEAITSEDGTISTNPTVVAMRREIQELRAVKDEFAKFREEFEGQKTQRQQEMELSEVTDYLKANPQYEVLNTLGDEASKKLLEVIKQRYAETGENMDLQEAADALEARELEIGLKYAKLRSIQDKLANAGTEASDDGSAGRTTGTASNSSHIVGGPKYGAAQKRSQPTTLTRDLAGSGARLQSRTAAKQEKVVSKIGAILDKYKAAK